MNWGGFPVGFRFPVEDFSPETKKRCWDSVLQALSYGNLKGVSLYEAESAERFDPARPVLIAAVSHLSIRESRSNSLLWRRDGALRSKLTLYMPAVQENYLELYTEKRCIAQVSLEGSIEPVKEAEGYLPKSLPAAGKPKSSSLRCLIAADPALPFLERESLCRLALYQLYQKDQGICGRLLPLGNGNEGTVETAAAFLRGRLSNLAVCAENGAQSSVLYAVTANRRLLLDGFSLPALEEPLSKDFGLGQALLKLKNRGFSEINLCARGLSHINAETLSSFSGCAVRFVEDCGEIYSLSTSLRGIERVYWIGDGEPTFPQDIETVYLEPTSIGGC